jgi:hypothetical protein
MPTLELKSATKIRRLSQAIWLGQHRLSDLTNLQYEVKELESMKLSDSAGLAKRQCLWPPSSFPRTRLTLRWPMSTISRDGMAQGCQSMQKLFITSRELDFQGVPEGAANGLSGSSCHLADPVAH